MVVYSLIEDKALWNQEIIQHENFNPYQSYEWGEYKKNFGWKVISLKSNLNGEIGYLQITYKIKFNIFVGWCIGSISGSIDGFEKNNLISFLQQQFNVKYVFIKSSFTNILDFNDSLSLYNAQWKKSCKKLNSDYSIYVDLRKDFDTLLADCSSNFRKNVKRGQNKNQNVFIKNLSEYEEDELIALFNRFKEIKDVLLPSKEEIGYLKKYLGNNIIIATSYINEEMVGLRAFLYQGSKALDFWASTDITGRKNYTSFMLLFELFQKAKELGIEEYDMSGIDPLDNPTGFSFKNGLRAQVAEKLGEWELSNSKILSFVINRIYL